MYRIQRGDKIIEKIIFTINGFQIKSLGNIVERIKDKFNIESEVKFIRSYSEPPIQFGGLIPGADIKRQIIKILSEEVEFGLLVDD